MTSSSIDIGVHLIMHHQACPVDFVVSMIMLLIITQLTQVYSHHLCEKTLIERVFVRSS